MSVLSDLHGDMQTLSEWVERNRDECDLMVQLGDLGFGFVPVPTFDEWRLKLVRGNHDSPDVARAHPNYAGDWSHFRYSPDPSSVLCIGGAWSIDHAFRTPGYSWWPDEELRESQWTEIEKEWRLSPPSVVISHDCPALVYPHVMSLNVGYIPSRTSEALERLRGFRPPSLWIFGHHHKDFDEEIEGTRFVCLGIGQEFNFDTQETQPVLKL